MWIWGGCCGVAPGAGSAFSILTKTTPMSIETWSAAQMVTANILTEIGKIGGPGCCKRASFLAITVATRFLKEHLQVELEESPKVRCDFSNYNKECLKKRCPFYFPKE